MLRSSPLCAILRIKSKAALQRVLLTKVTAAFFAFSLLVCFAQGIMSALLVTIDEQYYTLFHGIVQTANISKPEIDFLSGDVGSLTLKICNDIPYYGRDITNCTQVYPIQTLFDATFRRSEPDQVVDLDGRDDFSGASVIPRSDFGTFNVTLVAGDSSVPKDVTFNYPNGTTVTLVPGCTRSLLSAEKVFRNTKREGIFIVALQLWMFVMSFMAIIQNSVPHIVAILVARMLMTAWSAFTLWRSRRNSVIFYELYTTPLTYCNLDLGFKDYFRDRLRYQIPDIALNLFGLLVSAYMSWTILRTFRETKLMRVRAPDTVLDLYKYFMAVLVCLQLGGFLLMSTLGLWADQLFSVFITSISEHSRVYQALIIFTCIIILPIGAMGWVSIKRENRFLMAVFLALLFILLVCWSCMFASQVWRWTFMDWPMLAAINVASLTLIAVSMVLGGICWLNFGKGLRHYLYAQDMLESLDFSDGIVTANTGPPAEAVAAQGSSFIAPYTKQYHLGAIRSSSIAPFQEGKQREREPGTPLLSTHSSQASLVTLTPHASTGSAGSASLGTGYTQLEAPPSFVSRESSSLGSGVTETQAAGRGPPATTRRLMRVIESMRVRMDAMEPPPPYTTGENTEGNGRSRSGIEVETRLVNST